MSNRKILIDALASGDVNRLKRLRKLIYPGILISAPRDGKYFIIPDQGGKRKEISLPEIEKLKEDYTVIILTRAPGEVTGKIYNSEEELIKDVEQEIKDRKQINTKTNSHEN
jgi:hypothetical protein